MKNILLSARPKWTAKILNGEKTVEIRKNAPKCDLPVTVYIYCTKGDKSLIYSTDAEDVAWCKHDNKGRAWATHSNSLRKLCKHREWNGNVVAKFTLRKAERFVVGSLGCDDIQELACLTYTEMINYAYKPHELDGLTIKYLYAWHISDLVVFDKPLELGEFKVIDKEAVNKCANRERVYNNPNLTNGAWLLGGYVCKNNEYDDWCDPCRTKPLTRPPQSWQFVEPPTDGEED